MSYNQKPPGPSGSGLGGGIPPNGPNNPQQVAKTLAGIQQQMQSLVHGQNALPQSSQAELNVFLQQQRFQNMLKQQQQLLHFQMQQQQQHQQQHQQKDRAGGGGGGVGSGGGGGEPLALTRTPAAADLLNKTFQQHQQQQPNGGAAAPNAALNQFQQQLQALPPNIIQQLQTLQYQMQQHQQQQQHQHQQQQHPPQLPTPQSQHHPSHQQTPPPPSQQQQQQQPQPLLTAHQQQQLHGQLQHQQQKALQQLQQSLRYFPTAAATPATATPTQPITSVSGGNKGSTTAPPQQHPQPLPSTTIGSNQLKAQNLPPSTQITPVSGNVGPIGLIPGGIVQQTHQPAKNTVGNTPAPIQPTTATISSTSGGGANVTSAMGAKQVPTPSISLLPAKPGPSTTTTPTAAHQQNKLAGKTSPVVNAIPPPFPTHFQKPSAVATGGNATAANITPTVKTGTTASTGSTTPTLSSTVAAAATVSNKTPQQSTNPIPLTKVSLSSAAPATQSGAVTSAAAPTSAALTAATTPVTANNGNEVVADHANNAQKATISTPTVITPAPLINADASTAAKDKNVKSTTSDAPVAAKLEVASGKPANKASGETQRVAAPTKPPTTDGKEESNVNDSALVEETNAVAPLDNVKKSQIPPTDSSKSFDKKNAAAGGNKAPTEGSVGGINIAHGKSKEEQSKESTAKDQENNKSATPKAQAVAKAEEKFEGDKITAATPEDIIKQSSGLEAQSAKMTKDSEKNSDTPAATDKINDEEKSTGNIKETVEKKSHGSEKTEILNQKPTEGVNKSSSADTTLNKQTNTDKKEALHVVNDAKSTASSTIAAETKSKETPALVAATASTTTTKIADGDRRKIAANDKQKDEKIKNTKPEKKLVAAATAAATSSTTNSTIVEPSTQGNNNKQSATTKSTKPKAIEIAPDSTNSSISDATSTTSTSVKRSSRQPKTPIAKPTEKLAVEKSEKVSSSRSSKKTKSGIGSNNNSKSNSTVAVDVSIASVAASPVTPKHEQQTPSTSASDRKSSRHRLKTIPFQSPLPELAYITKLSASEASNSPKPMSIEDKLIVFYKNEYMAVRNAEGTFYLCQTMQNVYRTSPRISIRWLSEDPNKSGVYIPDFYDHTDIECVLTTVELKRVDKGHLSLPKKEQARIENILKKAIDVEKGLVPRPELTEENPDGLDISLYKDESQIEKKSATGATPTSTRKLRRIGNSIGGTPTTTKSSVSGSSRASASKGLKRSRSSLGSTSAADNGLNSSSKKKKSAAKRKSKSKKITISDDEIESSDDSDAEYKPNQKSKSSASRASPRAQRSPLARARAASPITSTTARSKNVPPKFTSTASSRGERANKRKAAADATTSTTENAPTPAKKPPTVSATPNASKSTNPKSKTQDSAIEASNSASVAKKTSSTTAETTNVVSSTTNTNNTTMTLGKVTTAAANSSGGASNNNRPTRSRK
ncbi:pneumococcal serine-rich repeat protein-like isoform X2 [Eurosta solidaginis]|uniref:pneumococcal serine-rich repeat protein-like isoform X2 n=1 Tax=Eurosta solidaginis TaxID=178769 RepID=UPI00353115ED